MKNQARKYILERNTQLENFTKQEERENMQENISSKY